MTFGTKLQNLRKEHSLSQEELSYQLGLSRQAISKWENNQGYPETDKLIQLSKMFKVSVDYLLNDENDEVNNPIQEVDALPKLSRETIESILFLRKKYALKTAIGVILCISSVSIILLQPIFDNMLNRKPASNNDAIYVVLTILIIAIAVAIFILTNMNKHSDLKSYDAAFYISSKDVEWLKEIYQPFHTHFVAAITIGVFLCIISVCFAILFDEINVFYEAIGTTCMINTIAAAVFLFVYFGLIQSTYTNLIDFDAHNKELEKENSKKYYDEHHESKISWLYAITMPLTAFWFLWYNIKDGFENVEANASFLVFPTVAILTYAITKIYDHFHEDNTTEI